MFTITQIDKYGACGKLPLKTGDCLTHINSCEVVDMLDYSYYDNIKCTSITILRSGTFFTYKLNKNEFQQFGLEFEADNYLTPITCQNKCQFCFVHQLPKGLRRSLYVMDDDWRLSFVAGNFVTFTNVSEAELQRIIKCKFSPLYVSVHSTQLQLRNKLLGNKNAYPIMPILQRLTKEGIKIHAQVVLCPNINDGPALNQTIEDLLSLGDNFLSLAVVPVGLTQHRNNLIQLEPVGIALAKEVLALVVKADAAQYKKSGRHRIYCSDEFYIKAQIAFPTIGYYEGLEQVENGVGLAAKLIDEFGFALQDAGKCKQDNFVIVTGESGKTVLDLLVSQAKQHDKNLKVVVKSIKNNFFGDSVTVSGLITATDIIKQLVVSKKEHILIPSSMLREMGDVFLDDITIEKFREKLGCKVSVVEVDGYALCNMLFEEKM